MTKLVGAGRPRMHHRIFAYLESSVPLSDRVDKDTFRSEATGGTWRWLMADAAGVAVAGPPVRFTSGEVAERWLFARARSLRALGARAVTLLDGEHVVYGPMSLPG